MRYRSSLILLALILLAACSRNARPKEPNPGQMISPQSLADFASFQQLRLTEDWSVGASSQKASTEDQSTEFFVERRTGGKWGKVFSQVLDGAYNPRIEIRQDVTYKGDPLIILHINYGAAAEVIDIYSIHQGTLMSLQTIAAGTFEWSFDQPRSQVILCGIPGSPIDPMDLYAWDGALFKPFKGKIHK